MDSLYIVIPAYNESETIRQVIDDWYPIIEEHNGGGNRVSLSLMMEARIIPMKLC